MHYNFNVTNMKNKNKKSMVFLFIQIYVNKKKFTKKERGGKAKDNY